MPVNPALLALAQRRVWSDAGGPPMEKVAVVPPEAPPGAMPPPGGAPPMDPAMAGGMPPPGGMPPMPPMDPAMGGMPPGGAPPMPMDPAMAGAPGAGAMPGMPGMDPAAGQKMKPEQMMQMLDFRLYNMQQQLTALMNAMDIQLPPGALVTPPGSPTPVAEAAVPGGPQDPAMAEGGGAGGGSAISPIGEIQGASPELAMGGGGGGGDPMGGEKMGSASMSELIEKMAQGGTAQGTVDQEGPRHSSPPQKLQGAHPGKRPGTQAITAGGSKDPLSRTEASDGMGAVNKSAAAIFAGDLGVRDPSKVGTPFDVMQTQSPVNNSAAVAAMLRRRVAGAA